MMPPKHAALSPNLTGVLLMVASMACFTINDAFVKATDGAVPLSQLLVLRGLLATALIAALAYWRSALRFGHTRRDWFFVGLRSLTEVGAAYFFLSALMNMPFANVTAILQVLPLTVTLAAAVVFRERIGWRRLLAIAVGFVGMLLIVRPGAAGFSLWALSAVAAVFCITGRDLATRCLSGSMPSLMVTLCASAAVLLVALVASLQAPWVPVAPAVGVQIICSALFIVGGYYFSVEVMRAGDVGLIAPFRYTGLIWALLLGWLAFGEWPDPLTLLGAGLIVATGLFTLFRERSLLRSDG